MAVAVDGRLWRVRLASGAERGARTRNSAPSKAAAPVQSQRPRHRRPPICRRSSTRTCVGCHNSRATTSATASGVDPRQARICTRRRLRRRVWEKVIGSCSAGAMPPAGMPRPERRRRPRWCRISRRRSIAPRRRIRIPAGRLPHRLNRAEYANAIRDLLALDVDASALLPPDDSADGFDNNADVARRVAVAARALSVRRREDQRARGRRSDDRRRVGDVSHSRRRVADRRRTKSCRRARAAG